MKNILLIGASGFVGSAILNEALSRGLQITALVRHPEKIKEHGDNLKIVKGDVSDPLTVEKTATGMDAVISAYNPGWANPEIYELTLKVSPAILESVKKAGVPRILFVGGAGTLFVKPGLRVVDTGAIPDNIMPGVRSLGEFYLNTLSREDQIDWVFFSPAGTIEPGKRTGNYRLGKDDLIVNGEGVSHISVEDYAKAMIDELEEPGHHKERFTIGY